MKRFEETKEEIRAEILEAIKNDIGGYLDNHVDSFIFDLFNADYYIIGTYACKEWLTEKGVFNCLEILTDYEDEMFGESNFDNSNPEQIVGRLALFMAEEILYCDMGLNPETIIDPEMIKLLEETE